jgi:hypothetical protein
MPIRFVLVQGDSHINGPDSDINGPSKFPTKRSLVFHPSSPTSGNNGDDKLCNTQNKLHKSMIKQLFNQRKTPAVVFVSIHGLSTGVTDGIVYCIRCDKF